MDKEPDLMEQDPIVIRHQIDETRSALTEKLETLEHEVKETVQGAKAAVTGTIESVKETVETTVENVKEKVQGTVDTVKQTLDITTYVEKYPWAMLGGAIGFGWVLGHICQSHERLAAVSNGHAARNGQVESEPSKVNGAAGRPPIASQAGSVPLPESEQKNADGNLVGELVHKFEPELQEIKRLAIGALGALVRDVVKESVPEPLAPRLEEVINHITTKLGGEAIPEPILPAKTPCSV
jgi:ElaB/YqjD/DUF883 family membrane-anchored ribosome-binding protein